MKLKAVGKGGGGIVVWQLGWWDMGGAQAGPDVYEERIAGGLVEFAAPDGMWVCPGRGHAPTVATRTRGWCCRLARRPGFAGSTVNYGQLPHSSRPEGQPSAVTRDCGRVVLLTRVGGKPSSGSPFSLSH